MASNISQGIALAKRVYKKKASKKRGKKKTAKRPKKHAKKHAKKRGSKKRGKKKSGKRYTTKAQIGRKKARYSTPVGSELHVNSTARLVKRGGKTVKKTETHAYAIRHGRRVKVPKA